MSSRNDRTGYGVGLACGLKLAESRVGEMLPTWIEQNSRQFFRAMLGVYSLVENAAASRVVVLDPKVSTPEFRLDLAAGVRNTAHWPGATIRLYDILGLRVEMEHFCKYHVDWLNRDGAESVVGRELTFQEAFTVMQDMRSLQFAAMAANTTAEAEYLPETAQKVGGAMIRSALMWVLGTTTISEQSMAEVSQIVEVTSEIAQVSCRLIVGS
ncbi:hypothetical protein [Opitutus terrae]|uniref:Uncharacterized protein n=1 Tax=Opitutus terrae (strain DSM 11246 / JCM 15787 / PB90-1) TaxID=452637 RepID=B1ZY25_OPITP|nr:hypothetical protein [Opitutus terrae]ACB75224.1 hypothetical protein Oter_1941 [Opitutus terrae PB90-1]